MAALEEKRNWPLWPFAELILVAHLQICEIYLQHIADIWHGFLEKTMVTAKVKKVKARDARDRFVDLANKRVTRAIKDLQLVGNLANKRSYEYSDNDAKKIIRALQKELDVLKARFRGDDGKDGSIFSL